MKAGVCRPNPQGEFPTPERCFILEMLNVPDDDSVSVARARVEERNTTQLHRLLGVDERYIILEGEGEVEVGGAQPTSVRGGDIVLIPRGTPQRITNTGKADLMFLCVCSPRFDPKCYEALE